MSDITGRTHTTSNTLTGFLLARIAEDEDVAKLCAQMFPPPWELGTRWGIAHVVRHDPARVLAECDAKRRIVEWAAPVLTNWPTVGLRYISDDGLDLLKILALPYADHPDYREEWRP